jgi:hypothetical protein
MTLAQARETVDAFPCSFEAPEAAEAMLRRLTHGG